LVFGCLELKWLLGDEKELDEGAFSDAAMLAKYKQARVVRIEVGHTATAITSLQVFYAYCKPGIDRASAHTRKRAKVKEGKKE